jgi:hypothetical protein
MPPRKKASRTRLPSTSPLRYQRVSGKARRFVDRNTGEEISYHERDKRLSGSGATRSVRRARRQGFATAGELRASYPRFVIDGRTYIATPGARKLARRRRDLATSWALALDASGTPYPTIRERSYTGEIVDRINLKWAYANSDFDALQIQLRELELGAIGRNRATDPYFAPDGLYAQTLVALGRRPPEYGYRVGDSPVGTILAMRQVAGGEAA